MYHTTLSTGQSFYVGQTTTWEECSKIASTIGNVNFDNNLLAKRTKSAVNEVLKKSVELFCENDVVIGDENKSLEIGFKLWNESIMEKKSGGNMKDGDDDSEGRKGIVLDIDNCLKEQKSVEK